MNSKDWHNITIHSNRNKEPKFDSRFVCPGLCRLTGMVFFLTISLITYYKGVSYFGLEPLNWADPDWTGKHLLLIGAGVISGSIVGILGFFSAATIKIRNERLNDAITILWQFIANGSLYWVLTIGTAMSISLGIEGAKSAVLLFGAEEAMIHVVGTGSGVGILIGIAYFLARNHWLPFIPYLSFCSLVSLLSAAWHYSVYDIEGVGWFPAGLINLILLLVFTPPMIERDRQKRNLVKERFSQYHRNDRV